MSVRNCDQVADQSLAPFGDRVSASAGLLSSAAKNCLTLSPPRASPQPARSPIEPINWRDDRSDGPVRSRFAADGAHAGRATQ